MQPEIYHDQTNDDHSGHELANMEAFFTAIRKAIDIRMSSVCDKMDSLGSRLQSLESRQKSLEDEIKAKSTSVASSPASSTPGGRTRKTPVALQV